MLIENSLVKNELINKSTAFKAINMNTNIDGFNHRETWKMCCQVPLKVNPSIFMNLGNSNPHCRI